jgi:hypothetical protein
MARIYPRRETFHFDSAFGRRGKPFALNRNGERQVLEHKTREISFLDGTTKKRLRKNSPAKQTAEQRLKSY